MTERAWYELHENLVALARFLEYDGQFATVEDVIEFFSEPWSWSAEWDHYQAGQAFLGETA